MNMSEWRLAAPKPNPLNPKPNHGDVAGIVLAGGLSRRLGRDKAVEPIGGEPLIRRVIRRLGAVAPRIVVVVNSEERGRALPLPPECAAAVDIYPDAGSLGGIFTGLSAAGSDWGVVVACDMPFLNADLLSAMFDARDGCDAVVPTLDGRPEPTHALYSKACLPHIERRLQSDDLKIARFFDDVNVRYFAQEEVDALDPGRLSFFNVNTPADLDRALALAADGR